MIAAGAPADGGARADARQGRSREVGRREPRGLSPVAPAARRQRALDAYAEGLGWGGARAPGYAADASQLAALLALAGGAVYLAGGRAYAREGVREALPELTLFRLRLDAAFAESPAHPGFWVETRRLAALRAAPGRL